MDKRKYLAKMQHKGDVFSVVLLGMPVMGAGKSAKTAKENARSALLVHLESTLKRQGKNAVIAASEKQTQ